MPGADRVVERRNAAPEPVAGRRTATRIYEWAVVVPLVSWLGYQIVLDPRGFDDPLLMLWILAIAVVDLLPVPTSVELRFSLSFPLQMAVALIYTPPVAAAIAVLGTSDRREFRRELPLGKALFIRAQIAASVVAESYLFHAMSSLRAPWYELGLVVMLATIIGYSVNVLLVAWYFHLQSREPLPQILREMHVGVLGEFVLSYMGLAFFSVLVATTFVRIGIWSVAVFIAPLAFARQMFQRTHSLQVATDELAAKQAEKEYQALHDALTDLPNRVLFSERLQEAIEETARRRGTLAVMLIDLDHFKEINDTLGHHFGDMLLKEVGPRLSGALREGDTMARLGGDEFGIVLPNLPNQQLAFRVAERLLEQLEQPLTVEGLALDVAGSIGVALYPAHSDDAETLMRRADVAMYAAKEAGGGFELYNPALDQHNPRRLALAGQVRPGIDNHEFLLHYQPQLNLADGKVAGVEALVRWDHPERGLVPPDDFIPLIERTVLLRPFTYYVLNEALHQWHVWDRSGIRITIAVNLSPRSLMDTQLPEQVAELLERWRVPPEWLTLELTESFLMAESGRSISVLAQLSEVGVNLSIDDFGTGYSSLSHLRRLPIREIKVDRSFVAGMMSDPNDEMIVRAIVDLGRNLGLRVVAEGVENRETWDELASLGCDLAQGYHMSKPLPTRETTQWLVSRIPGTVLRTDDETKDPDAEPGLGHLRAL